MPSRRGRGRTTRRTAEESRAGSDDDVHQVENVTRQIGEMELVLARFQRTNHPTFSAAEGGAMAEAWLAQMEELFDTLEYAPEKRLKLAVLQLRDNAQYDDVHQVENVTRQIGEMELVLARFQRTNHPTFSAAEGGAMAEAWLAQMEELFDTLEYAPEKRLKLAVLQLRDNAQRLWRCPSRILRDSGAFVRPRAHIRVKTHKHMRKLSKSG
ncbi:hypothetical protein F511_11750 [Dorcoceras hygrometricum]|uniref:Uncharacterized protein n=1 Tax=Dorcoceras hygrometricum TaxID=472368 RepID=A0A2Z7B9N2_9LAMI|nr:hypothetical protein F511_11750 [Dorcoceras hygrometricum]